MGDGLAALRYFTFTRRKTEILRHFDLDLEEPVRRVGRCPIRSIRQTFLAEDCVLPHNAVRVEVRRPRDVRHIIRDGNRCQELAFRVRRIKSRNITFPDLAAI